MDSEMTTSKWIKFFIEAGLPSNVAANYAIIFTDHRIQLDMLLELSKEYLFDMGIRTLGDIIAILRHAKVAHNQAAKEKLIISDTVQAGSSPSARRSTPASRIVGHYTRRVNEIPESCTRSTNIKMEKKIEDTEVNRTGKGTIISLKRKPAKETQIPTKKVRRVLPEHEGTYKITMPSGTVKKTRKILQQQGLDVAKRSVFDRLGESAVSSSTDVVSLKNSSVFERLGPSKAPLSKQISVLSKDDDDNESVSPLPYQGVLKVNNVTRMMPIDTIKITKVIRRSEDQEKSVVTINKRNVMNRLGPKTSLTLKTARVTSSSEPPSLIIRKSIFDAQISRKKMAVISPTTTAGILGSDSETGRVNVKTRLGHNFGSRQLLNEQPRRTVTSNILGKGSITKRAVISPTTDSRNVFQRLGPSAINF